MFMMSRREKENTMAEEIDSASQLERMEEITARMDQMELERMKELIASQKARMHELDTMQDLGTVEHEDHGTDSTSDEEITTDPIGSFE